MRTLALLLTLTVIGCGDPRDPEDYRIERNAITGEYRIMAPSRVNGMHEARWWFSIRDSATAEKIIVELADICRRSDSSLTAYYARKNAWEKIR